MTDAPTFFLPDYYTLFDDKDNPPLEPPPIPPPNTVILSSDTYWNMSYRVPIETIGRLESVTEKEFLKQLNDKLFLLFMQFFHEKIYEPEIDDTNNKATLRTIVKVYNNLIRSLNVLREQEAHDELNKVIDKRQEQCDKMTKEIEDIVHILESGNIEELKKRFIK